MSDNNDYLRTNQTRSFRLRADILALMLKGASYAAIACVTAWLILAVIMWLGQLLPDESRETEDPTPFSFKLGEPMVSAEV